MNKKQWFTLGIVFVIFAVLFYMASESHKDSCEFFTGLELPHSLTGFSSCVRAEVYSPFHPMLFVLGVVFLIFGLLEPKRK